MTKEQWISSLADWLYKRQDRMMDEDTGYYLNYFMLESEIREWVKTLNTYDSGD